MYPMDKFSAIMWINTVKRAQMGDKHEQEMIDVENKIRMEEGQPTVEEELQEILGNKWNVK